VLARTSTFFINPAAGIFFLMGDYKTAKFIKCGHLYHSMYVEKRKKEAVTKYYLVHSYREKGSVQKIRKYLGQNLTKEDLAKNAEEAKKQILELIKEINTDVFLFTLTKKQVQVLNKYDKKIKIAHLNKKQWQEFEGNFVYNTNAIEGSTVQFGEVKELLEQGKPPKNYEEIETKGVAKALEYIKTTKEDLSLELIQKIHEICFRGSKGFAGKFRDANVAVMNSQGQVIHAGVRKEHLFTALKEFIDWHKKNKNKFKPLVLAAIIHDQFEHIHPFQDGNGRVGRLLLNFILIKHRYPPINILLADRAEYYFTLHEYSKNGNLKPTLEFLIKQYKKSLKGAHKTQ